MRLKYIAILALTGLFASTAPIPAHHGFASEYDLDTVLTLTGIVRKVDWTNPHIYIYLDVRDASGKVTAWSLAGYPPNTLKRNGFPRSSFKEGETVTITVYRSKDGSNSGAAREVTFPDGSKKFAGQAAR